MSQSRPRKISIDQMLRLVDELSPEEQEQLRRKLDLKPWGEQWDALVKKVREQSKHLPPLSQEDILAEMKEIKNELKAERA